MTTEVLNESQIRQKLNRIAYEIVENNFEAPTLFLVGIKGNGVELAKRLKAILEGITDQDLQLATLTINKKNPLKDPINLTCDGALFENGTVILIDDVLNSGKTMQYAIAKLLEQQLYKLKTVTLVDRKHRRYPVRCDYVGLTLSTTLQDRIAVDFKGEAKAYLV